MTWVTRTRMKMHSRPGSFKPKPNAKRCSRIFLPSLNCSTGHNKQFKILSSDSWREKSPLPQNYSILSRATSWISSICALARESQPNSWSCWPKICTLTSYRPHGASTTRLQTSQPQPGCLISSRESSSSRNFRASLTSDSPASGSEVFSSLRLTSQPRDSRLPRRTTGLSKSSLWSSRLTPARINSLITLQDSYCLASRCRELSTRRRTKRSSWLSHWVETCLWWTSSGSTRARSTRSSRAFRSRFQCTSTSRGLTWSLRSRFLPRASHPSSGTSVAWHSSHGLPSEQRAMKFLLRPHAAWVCSEGLVRARFSQCVESESRVLSKTQSNSLLTTIKEKRSYSATNGES